MAFFTLNQRTGVPDRLPETPSLVDRGQLLAIEEDAAFLVVVASKINTFPICPQDVIGKQYMVHMRPGARVQVFKLDGEAVECTLNESGEIDVRQMSGAEVMAGSGGFGVDVHTQVERKKIKWNEDLSPGMVALLEARFTPKQQEYIALAYGLGLGGKAPLESSQIAHGMGMAPHDVAALARNVKEVMMQPSVRNECANNEFSFETYRDRKMGLGLMLEVVPTPSMLAEEEAADLALRARLENSPFAFPDPWAFSGAPKKKK